jgi:DNA-binding SARP family transcriptional activator
LIYNFDFEKGVRNKVDKTLYENELFSVCFRNEKGHGKVLCLNKDGAAVQFKKSPEFDTSKPFTISARVNPDSVNAIHTIVSKGLVFSLKIRRGGLSFAGTGFQSVILDSLLIETGKWHHIVCVYVPGYHVQFFLNGQLVHDEAFDSLKVTEQALTIGNNFSNEAFSGQIDDLMIWNRALSADEIELLFSERNKSSVFPLLLWSFIIVIVLLLVFFILVRSGKMQLKPLVIKTQKEEISSSESQQQICLFGELFISGINEENLAKQLTPRLKQLFVLLAIHPNGVSIGRINNDLWPGVDDEKAKQSRNYAIQQLKKVLSANPAIRLEYLSKNWILQFDENIKVDALLLEEIGEQLKQQFTVSLLDAYLSIAERGKFLPGIDNECFDAIKTKISENISTHVLAWAENATPKTCLRLGNILLLQDSLSEDGLRISVRALAALGRNGEAMELYQTFAKRYKNTYSESFLAPFQSFI